MPTFETSRVVRHTPEQMFDLVADVRRYPEFLPLCERLTVKSEQERDGKRLLVADMTVAYKFMRETFTTQVLLKPEEHRIDVKYVEGPFKYLDNRWTFAPASNGTDVRFFIDYEMKSRALGALVGTVFERAFRRFAQAFEERADEVYGASASPA